MATSPKRRRRRAPVQRYSRPAYRWSDDLDVIVGVLGIAGLMAFIAVRTLAPDLIPNL